jgi:hypothetical protein
MRRNGWVYIYRLTEQGAAPEGREWQARGTPANRHILQRTAP